VKAKTPGYAEFLPADRGRARQQMQALRLGDFIGVRYDIKSHAAPFEIYNLAADPQQRHDLGGNTEFAAMQREMHDTVLRVRRPDASAPRPYDAELVPALRVEKIAPGVEWRAYEIAAPWVAKLDAMPPAARGVQAAPDLSHTPPGRDFAMLFSGFIEAPEDGEYTFSVKTDTGALLRIHEATVLECDPTFSEKREASGAIRLQKGRHPFRLYYRHRGADDPALALNWSRGGAPAEPIPAAAFSHLESP